MSLFEPERRTMEKMDREETIFERALAIESDTAREAYLQEACAGDGSLLRSIQQLLMIHGRAGKFMDPTSAGGALKAALPPDSGVQPVHLTEKAGDRIGRYKLLEKIGEGGCGVVYMAEQAEPIRRRVALKIIKMGMDTKAVVARFEAERQALALMEHPNIAKVHDAGATEAGRPYFVMELVRGMKITQYCDEQKLSTRERLQLFIQVCRAVQHAHQKGIVHRDLKPSNILVSINDGVAVPKVIDFGIAKATSGEPLTEKTVFTSFTQLIGTPAYMSPEQALVSSVDVDTRTDIYALGVLLYELLTGTTPFDSKELLAAGLDAMRRTIREAEPPRPSTRLSTLPDQAQSTTAQRRGLAAPKLVSQLRGDLDWIVMKCLEKDRARRYETANGLATDIQRHLKNEPVVASPPSNLYRIQKMVRRNTLAFVCGAAVISSLFCGLGLATLMFVREREAKHEQVRLRQEAESKEKLAQREAAKKEQIAGILKDMLGGTEPEVAKGRDTTILRELLDEADARIHRELTNEPEVLSELLRVISHTYFDLGLTKRAEEIAGENVEMAKSRLGEENLFFADALGDLGTAKIRNGSTGWAESENLLRRAIALRTRLAGAQSPGVLFFKGTLAVLLKEKGRLAEAEEILHDQVSFFTKTGQDARAALALNNLGTVLTLRGQPDQAEQAFREAVKVSQRIDKVRWGPALYLGNLADTLIRKEKWSEAEQMYRQALAADQQLWGEGYEHLTRRVEDLVFVLRQQGKYAEAEQVLQDAFQNRRKRSGDQAVGLLQLTEDLATVFRDERKLQEEEKLYREALPFARSALTNAASSEAHLSGVVLHHLARVLGQQGSSAEARPYVEEALAAYDLHPDWSVRERNCALRVLHEVLTNLGDTRALQVLRRKEGGNLLAAYREPAEAKEANADDWNNYAWFLATSSFAENRDGHAAVSYAEKAVAATGRTNFGHLDTLAAAYAEAGEFSKAIGAVKEAVTLVNDGKIKAELDSRLKLYESNTPYREQGP